MRSESVKARTTRKMRQTLMIEHWIWSVVRSKSVMVARAGLQMMREVLDGCSEFVVRKVVILHGVVMAWTTTVR